MHNMATKRHTTTVTCLKHERACKSRRYHTQALEPALGVTIHVPDRQTRYDITPYTTYYDAVVLFFNKTPETSTGADAALCVLSHDT